MQHKDIRSYVDSGLFILGICIVIRQAFALDNFNEIECID